MLGVRSLRRLLLLSSSRGSTLKEHHHHHALTCTTATEQRRGSKMQTTSINASYGAPPPPPPPPPSDSDSSSSSSSSDSEGPNVGGYSRAGRTTYVEEEVEKFRAMADSWWDVDGDCKPLHSLNKLRVALVREGLVNSRVSRAEYVTGPRPLTGIKILDVGCGGGILCEPLARLGAQVTGLDAAEENVRVATLHASQDPRVEENVVYLHGTVEEHIGEVGCVYDAVVASEVLEHVHDTELFIYTCAEAVKPGGSLFLTTINKTYSAWVGAIAVAEHMLRLLPPGTHDWNKFIPKQELLFYLEKCGFVTRTVHGMGYNPLRNDWFWLSNTSVNYAVHAIKEAPRGDLSSR